MIHTKMNYNHKHNNHEMVIFYLFILFFGCLFLPYENPWGQRKTVIFFFFLNWWIEKLSLSLEKFISSSMNFLSLKALMDLSIIINAMHPLYAFRNNSVSFCHILSSPLSLLPFLLSSSFTKFSIFFLWIVILPFSVYRNSLNPPVMSWPAINWCPKTPFSFLNNSPHPSFLLLK